jgi:crotonobetainyl-CoA:carnitine CoA-transferase CaiB-like acyl-CoA transferase
MTEQATVFGDVNVLDLSSRLSGAYCARLFGDWGATVVLAEPPEGHPLRAEPPFLDGVPGRDRSLLHAYANANKSFATLASDDATGLEQWLTWADVVVTTGVSPAIAVPATAIHVSVTPHGLTGPLAQAPGNDLTAFARSSWAVTNGDPDAPPLKGSHNQAGYLAGLTAFVASAASVCERDRSGLGQLIDVSELEALTTIAGPATLGAEYAGSVPPRGRPDIIRGPVACKDGHFSLTISRAQFWRDAMNVLGLHELAQDERYSQAGYRRRTRDQYSPIVEDRLREWNKWELFDALAAVRCVAGVTLDTREVNDNPHLAARNFFVEVEIAGERRVQFPGAPVKMNATPWRSPTPQPPPPLRRERGSQERGLSASIDAGPRSSGSRLVTADVSHASKPEARTAAVNGPPRSDPTPRLTVTTRAVTQSRSVSDSPSPAAAGEGPSVGIQGSPQINQGWGPLANVRAIVLTQAWSGTYATELLALLGAEVIQIEARRRPDSWRGDYKAPVPEAIRDATKRQRPWNTSGLYNAVNLNKRGMTLDLQDPRGVALYKRLVPYSDIVAENFSPRVMGNLGLDYDSLKQLRPDIILASLSAYGATGPYANVPGIGGTIEPMSGMSALLGYEGGRPQNSGSMYPDPVAGSYFAAALIMALRHRDRTGEGQYIDLGMMEANATFIGDALLEQAANGVIRPRMGNRHPRIAPHNIYPAKDGRWLALSADDEAAWQALVTAIGRGDMLSDPRFENMAARKANEHAIDAAIEAWTRLQDPHEAAATLASKGLCAAPTLDPLEVLDEPQLRSRGLFVEVDHPEAGCRLQPGAPWLLSRTPARVTRPAPIMGQHSREVLAEFLGVTDDEYDDLVAAGVTGDMPP